MEFTEKLNSEVTNIAATVKTGIDTCVAEGKIVGQQRKIRQLTKEIGKLVIFRLDDGEQMSPEIMERYEAIKALRDEIDALEKGKGSTEPVCPDCGAKIPAGMKYCGHCGAQMPEPEVEAEA